MKLGAKIQRLRDNQDLTQMQLAERAGVTQAYVARIESDKVKNPKASGLAGLAKVLGVPVEVLLDSTLSIETWQNQATSININDADRELLKIYRALRPKQKKLLLEFAALLNNQELKK